MLKCILHTLTTTSRWIIAVHATNRDHRMACKNWLPFYFLSKPLSYKITCRCRDLTYPKIKTLISIRLGNLVPIPDTCRSVSCRETCHSTTHQNPEPYDTDKPARALLPLLSFQGVNFCPEKLCSSRNLSSAECVGMASYCTERDQTRCTTRKSEVSISTSCAGRKVWKTKGTAIGAEVNTTD